MKIETLLGNVKTVIKRAKSKPLPLNVSEVGLFGSLLFGKKNPGDADLYIEFEGTTVEGKIWHQNLEEFSDYLFDLSEGYRSTKQFIDDNFDALKERDLKPEWMRFAPLRNIRGKDRHGMTYGSPIISSTQIVKRILTEGCGGINFQDPPSNTPSVVLFDGKECYSERISPSEDRLIELFKEERRSLRTDLSSYDRTSCIVRLVEQISYAGEVAPNRELWEVIRNVIDSLKTEVISQSAPYLVFRYREEVEKILEENQKSRAGSLADSKIKVLKE
ncbi:hypothetical protein AKJ37_01555 [candidate division MSBL1 archaeon SCGC-AAA259I09]|uniref:Uncharacterized protein n=1 Tax=candidate division MSBL1 archaeon SCGC-AAA259I09 TaxID=1698267 RepID=A0A133UVA6_9EURY|nr:hypothetical protein AKJ37_01555 [candidate division MSBL1 archaeon SCGC-AAA259I09]